ncbi:hypothetical protein SESBI_45098 [Sesbania bispinosa]|nr:hypothetical protein SESBI_45098 [Sesbania bispinosa]
MTGVEPTFEESNCVAVERLASECGSRSGMTHALLGLKLWWRVGKCEGKYEFKSITWDSHALEMVNYAIAHNIEVNIVVEHVSVAVPNVIKALLGPEDKGKAVEVGDGSLEDSRSEESIDGSWEDFLFDDSEDESIFQSVDGFGEGETGYVGNEQTEEVDGTLHTDGVLNTEATPHNGGGTSQTGGVPNTEATPHNAGGTSQTEGVPHIEATPHNEGPSQTDATPQSEEDPPHPGPFSFGASSHSPTVSPFFVMEGGLGPNPNPASGSIDRSKIVEVKPLRSLAPVFPKSLQSFFSGRYPSGFPPFISSEEPQEPPIPKPAPLRCYRSSSVEETTPDGVNGVNASSVDGFNGDHVADNQKRAASPLQSCKSSQKRNKKTQESQVNHPSSFVGINPAQKDDGDREAVNLVLMTFDSLRRRLCQLEDAKELNTTGAIKRADLRASNALTCKGVRTNTMKRVGVVPGVEIGDIFFFRMEMCLVGLHGQSMGGIDYMTIKDENQEEPVAISIVSSGVYDNDAEDNDVLIYSGQGENFNKKDKYVTDQKLQRGNLALDKSSRRHNEVRVIRGLRDAMNKTAKIYVYDGLYKIQDSWIERGKSGGGGGVFKYKFVRLPGQPSAFANWKLVQKWKEDSASRNGFILADLSTGVESIPVSLVNDIDNEKGPAFFSYFHSLRNPKPFGLMQPSYGCNCNKACVPGDLSCSCIQRNEGDFPYTANSILVSRKQLVHECGPMCRCLPNCKNRVSQAGLKHHMEVFKTKDRGWGLRSLDPIRAGTFICEYAGEVIDRAKVYYNDEYVFDTSRIYEPFKWNHEPSLLEEVSSNVSSEDYTLPSPLVISAKDVGNVARFMNHSCSPNVFWQPVLHAENNQSFLHIAFFALRHIPPMTELTYDYGVVRSGHAEGSSAPKGRKKCLCGSSKCRGSFG